MSSDFCSLACVVFPWGWKGRLEFKVNLIYLVFPRTKAGSFPKLTGVQSFVENNPWLLPGLCWRVTIPVCPMNVRQSCHKSWRSGSKINGSCREQDLVSFITVLWVEKKFSWFPSGFRQPTYWCSAAIIQLQVRFAQKNSVVIAFNALNSHQHGAQAREQTPLQSAAGVPRIVSSCPSVWKLFAMSVVYCHLQ